MKRSLFPSFSETEYERRYRNIRQMMSEQGVRTLIIYGDSSMNRTAQGKPPGDFVFKPNICLVIQPNIVTPDCKKGVQLGNLCLVTGTGLEPLQKYPIKFVRAG